LSKNISSVIYQIDLENLFKKSECLKVGLPKIKSFENWLV